MNTTKFTGKRRTPRQAILAFCRECMGGNSQLVTACASSACPFHKYRQGPIPEGADRRLLRIIRRHCYEQCLPREDPAGCTAYDKFLDLLPCPVWPFRLGTNPNIGPEQREKQRERAEKQYYLSDGQASFAPRIDGKTATHTLTHGKGGGLENCRR